MYNNNCGCMGVPTYRNTYNDGPCCRCASQDDPCEEEPPTPFCEPEPVYCKPISVKCCPEKPKKSFWQTLFGDLKCKRRQGCVSKRPRKPKCKLVQEDVCEEPNEQPLEPVSNCRCTSNACPRRGCMPNQKSVFGGHLYFNVENRPKHHALKDDKPQTAKIPCEEPQKANIPYEEPQKANIPYEEPQKDGFPATKSPYSIRPDQSFYSIPKSIPPINQQSRISFTPFDYSPKRSNNGFIKKQSKCSIGGLIKEPPKSENVRFGVTFTKEETKYLKPKNTSLCQERAQVDKCQVDESNSESNSSNQSSEQYITLEFKKSGKKRKQNESDAKQRAHLSVIDDYIQHPNYPHSESLNRELLPLLKKKAAGEEDEEDEDELNEYSYSAARQNRRSLPRQSLRPSLSRTSFLNQDLDKTVCQILQKLNEIERKITTIEKKETDRKIKIDYDGKQSTVSLRFKDLDATKEIYHENKQPNQKIVIKLPKNNNKTRNRSWYDVADDLKCSSVAEKCYCYECVLKRVRC